MKKKKVKEKNNMKQERKEKIDKRGKEKEK